MKPRLFWKILLAFSLTVALAAGAIILTVALETHFGRDIERIVNQQRTERISAATVAYRYGGQAALDQVAASWPADERSRLRIARRGDGPARIVLQPPTHHAAGLMPFWPLFIEFGAGLVVSAALAAYLARPIRRLRDGFRRLALGDLDVRLAPGMGRRRDEIADLAQDFDLMAERLQQLIASRDRLLHDVSHELRSPLARLSLAVAIARQNEGPDVQALARIETEGARLNAIVGDLLSLSRAESEAGAEEIYFDLASLLELVCEDARFEAQPKDVQVTLAIDPALADPERAPVLRGAPELLRRAVENVIRNALRFSPPGRTVDVRAGIDQGSVVIEVRDEGPGAPPELLPSMFDPFVKGAGEARGVGLGLAIARRALAAHDGDVQASNLPEGGLLVRLTLPVDRRADAAGPRPAAEAPDRA